MAVWLLLWLVASGWKALAQPASGSPGAPVARVAIVAESSAIEPAIDVLTLEFSKRPGVVLLERSEIEKVYREQTLSAGERDYLRLGQMLGADGLVVLGTKGEEGNQWMVGRLVAVKTGVVLGAARAAWPVEQPVEWSQWMAGQFETLLPKLGVVAQDALPISILNLRSAVRSPQSQELERQLTPLLVERLSRQPEVFVLERRRMDLLSAEDELSGRDDAFWSGSYVLDGVVDRDGFSADQMVLNVRLAPPKGGTPIELDVQAPRTNMAAAVDRLAERVLEKLNVGAGKVTWEPAAEAERFFREGQWAYRWKMLPEAGAAFESAWALGRQTPEVALARIRASSDLGAEPMRIGLDWQRKRVLFSPQIQLTRGSFVMPLPPTMGGSGRASPEALAALERALELDCSAFVNFVDPTNKPDPAWYALSIQMLERASRTLQHYYFVPELREGREESIARVQDLAARLCGLMEHHPAFTNESSPATELNLPQQGEVPLMSDNRSRLGNLLYLKAVWALYWTRTPEEGVEVYRGLLRGGHWPKLRRLFLEPDLYESTIVQDARNPRLWTSGGELQEARPVVYLVGWKGDDRRRTLDVWHRFIDETCALPDVDLQFEGRFLRCAQARTEEKFNQAFETLVGFVKEHAQKLVADRIIAGSGRDLETLLAPRWRAGFNESAWKVRTQMLAEAKTALEQAGVHKQVFELSAQLVEIETQLTNGVFDFSKFQKFYPRFGCTADEAREILPLVRSLQSNAMAQIAALGPLPAAGSPVVPSGQEWRRQCELIRNAGTLRGVVMQTQEVERRLLEILAPAPTPAAPKIESPILSPAVAGSPPAAVQQSAEEQIDDVRFWKLPHQLPGTNGGASQGIVGVLFRDGRFWVDARAEHIGAYAGQETFFNQGVIYEVDPESFASETIVLDRRKFALSMAGRNRSRISSFEVFDGCLYVSSGDEVQRYSLKDKRWEVLPVPVQGQVRLCVVQNRLLLSGEDSILEIAADGKQSRVLASSRRQPSRSLLDKLDSFGCAPLFAGSDGALRAWVAGRLYSLPAHSEDWLALGSGPDDMQTECVPCDSGVLLVHSHAGANRLVYGLFPASETPELLLDLGPGHAMPVGFPRQLAERLKPRWDWPRTSNPGAVYSMCLEGQALWVASGVFTSPLPIAMARENSGAQPRTVTLYSFEPGITRPMILKFNPPWANEAGHGGLSALQPRQIFFSSPAGLIVASGATHGFGLIPQAQLDRRRSVWRERQPSGASDANRGSERPPSNAKPKETL